MQPCQDLVEMVMARNDLPKHERCPQLGKDLGRSRDRAELAVSIHVPIPGQHRPLDNSELRSGNFALRTIARQTWEVGPEQVTKPRQRGREMKGRFAGGALSAMIACFATFATAGAGVPVVLAAPNNVVIAWNQTMLSTFQAAALPPPVANRLGAIVQSAVFDAVNGIENRYTPIHVQPGAPAEADPHPAP